MATKILINGERAKFRAFVVDDSSLKIDGKRHVLLACLAFSDPVVSAVQVVEAKAQGDLAPDFEIKWGRRDYNKSLEDGLTDALFRVIEGADCAFVTLVEGNAKEESAKIIANQIASYCDEEGIGAFTLTFDENLAGNLWEIREILARSKAWCLGLNSHDSKWDQLIQMSDLYAGFFGYAIRKAAGEPLTGRIKLDLDGSLGDEFAEEDLPLDLWFLSSAQTLLWHSTESWKDADGFEGVSTNANGLGFLIRSTVNEEIQSKIRGLVRS